MFVWFYLVLKKSALRQTPLGMSDTGIAHGCCHLVPPQLPAVRLRERPILSGVAPGGKGKKSVHI